MFEIYCPHTGLPESLCPYTLTTPCYFELVVNLLELIPYEDASEYIWWVRGFYNEPRAKMPLWVSEAIQECVSRDPDYIPF